MNENYNSTIYMHFFGKESGRVEIRELRCFVNDYYVFVNDTILLKSPQSNFLTPGVGDLVYKADRGLYVMYLFERNPMKYIKAFIEKQKSIVAEAERKYLDAKQTLEQVEKCVYKQIYPTISQSAEFYLLIAAGIPDRVLTELEYSVWAYENTHKVKVVGDELQTTDERIFLDAGRWWDGCMETEDFIESVFHCFDIRPIEIIEELEGKTVICSHCDNSFVFSDDEGCCILKNKPLCSKCCEQETAICQGCFTRQKIADMNNESICKECQKKEGDADGC